MKSVLDFTVKIKITKVRACKSRSAGIANSMDLDQSGSSCSKHCLLNKLVKRSTH